VTAAAIAMAVSGQRYPFDDLALPHMPPVSSRGKLLGSIKSTSLIRILLFSVFVTVDFVFDLLESLCSH
jgi:hypothetical protein